MPSPRDRIIQTILEEAPVEFKPSRFSGEDSFSLDGREFCHFHSDEEIDVRIGRENLKPLEGDPRAIFRKNRSDWVAFRFVADEDVDRACELIRLALRGVTRSG